MGSRQPGRLVQKLTRRSAERRHRPIQILDRSDAGRIDWDERTEGGGAITRQAAKTAR